MNETKAKTQGNLIHLESFSRVRKGMCWEKTPGESTYVATIIAVFVMVLMFIALFLNYSTLVQYNKIDRIPRKYLLRMEKDGYLTQELQLQLQKELTDYGMENIDFTGTSLQPVGYGNEVRLCITGIVYSERLQGSPGYRISKKKEGARIYIEKTGTALY